MDTDFSTYFVYTIIPLLVIYLCSIDNKFLKLNTNFRNEGTSIFSIILIFVFVFFVGLRYEVGRDYSAYSGWYKQLVNTGVFPVNNDFGFIWLNKFLSFLNAEAYWLFIIIAFLQIYFFQRATRIIKQFRPWIYFFFFTLLCFFMSMNAMRQMLAFFILVNVLQLYNDKRYFQMILLAFIGISFHKTILIPLIILPIVHLKWFGPRLIQFLILISATWLFPPYFNLILEYVSPFINLLGYDYYIENLDFMKEITDENKRGDGTSYILFFILDTFIILYFSKLSETFQSMWFKQFYGYFFIGLVLSRLFQENFILARIADYYILFRLFILAFLSFYIFRISKSPFQKLERPFMSLLIIGLVAFYYKAIFNNAADISPFKFIFYD